MSIFKTFFGSSDEEITSSKINWLPLTKIQQLNKMSIDSYEKPIIIFKHSTRCSISRMALKQFEKEFILKEEEVTTYFLDLLSYREISNEIASRFQVFHQSPQLILLKKGIAVYHVSHSDIDAADLTNNI
ncbi:bacillithiol system redox-active protein YtxJ [Flavobacterium sp. GT3R68]|uniref:bacillithiol system redox-active protein YtxJ n=1 Tax=Flavobacterium sp. GT3R68 TaxID=2594437 RepID=UPI000F885FEC|nr:bacillithiol system redox-active protein YtxJ [Flavobacterium sp. GT3R68]RTY95060.1 bacillithiol system redox-active protein YtxJ [Flavobacterium sp. GSN2]TRW91866.1 bacillithiol system redox-active protein YtxJ [Flavobacterium sp. GT3R68]